MTVALGWLIGLFVGFIGGRYFFPSEETVHERDKQEILKYPGHVPPRALPRARDYGR